MADPDRRTPLLASYENAAVIVPGITAEQAWGDDSRLSSSFTMPWGEEYSGATLVSMYLAELAAHAWDLALATGQLDRLDPSLAVSALDGARAMIKPEYRDHGGDGIALRGGRSATS